MSVNILGKPTRPFCGGLYAITLDGYVVCTQRRSSQLKGLLLRPSLEYGKLVYRITVNGKTTTIRAFIVVRDAWGQHMQDFGDHSEMCKIIDTHNATLRTKHREKMTAKKRKPINKGTCPYCSKKPILPYPRAKTCGDKPCIAANKLVVEQARKRAIAEKGKQNDTAKPYVLEIGQYSMPCPWAERKLDTLPPGVASWADPIMDPMGGGFPMRTFSVPSTAREVAA